MKIWTCQMARWRLARDRGIPLVDTTTKSGIKAFAPGWDIVLPVKAGTLSEAEYTRIYIERLEFSEIVYSEDWEALLGQPEVVLACYCAAGKFCHRHLLATYLQTLLVSKGKPCELMGEML